MRPRDVPRAAEAFDRDSGKWSDSFGNGTDRKAWPTGIKVFQKIVAVRENVPSACSTVDLKL